MKQIKRHTKFRLHFIVCGYIERKVRDVVQPGRALAWGARSRRFKSSRPDQLKIPTLTGRYFFIPQRFRNSAILIFRRW